MKRLLPLLAAAAAAAWGCETFHEDYSVHIVSEPSSAEVWRGGYYLGTTPYIMTITATDAEKDAGTVVFPPVTVRKAGYREQEVALELTVGEGQYWECMVEMAPAGVAEEGAPKP